jgi:hypothetical protein
LSTDFAHGHQRGRAAAVGKYAPADPAARAPKVAWATSRSDALDMLTLASMLHRRRDRADVKSLVP